MAQRKARSPSVDTGVGFQASGGSLGTGLAALRERLLWAYGGSATLALNEVTPHGVEAMIEFGEKP